METKTGASRRLFLSLLVPAASLFAAAKKKKGDEEKKVLASVISGTVFREPGFAVPGAQVVLIEAVDGPKKKKKTWQAVTDARGEFAFRLPPQESKFKIKASANGLQAEEKDTASAPGVRVDVFFTLKPAAQ